MKPYTNSLSLSGLALVVALPLVFGTAWGASAPATPGTNSVAAHEVPLSVFNVPATPKEGRNPFFPQSSPIQPKPVRDPNRDGAKIDLSNITLNGITSPPKRTAIINNRTFEPGESGEIKLPTGVKMMIKCEEIRNDSAIIILAGGQRVELRLKSGL